MVVQTNCLIKCPNREVGCKFKVSMREHHCSLLANTPNACFYVVVGVVLSCTVQYVVVEFCVQYFV